MTQLSDLTPYLTKTIARTKIGRFVSKRKYALAGLVATVQI